MSAYPPPQKKEKIQIKKRTTPPKDVIRFQFFLTHR